MSQLHSGLILVLSTLLRILARPTFSTAHFIRVHYTKNFLAHKTHCVRTSAHPFIRLDARWWHAGQPKENLLYDTFCDAAEVLDQSSAAVSPQGESSLGQSGHAAWELIFLGHNMDVRAHPGGVWGERVNARASYSTDEIAATVVKICATHL